MADTRFVLDTKGVGRLLKSDEMLKLVTDEAKRRCPGGHHVKAFRGFDRARAIVYPDTKEQPS